MQSIEPHDQIKLAPPPSSASGATLLQDIANSTLVAEFCRSRAVVSIVMDGCTVLLVECLVPLDRFWQRNELPDSIVVQMLPVDKNNHQFAVVNMALQVILDNLMACGAEKIAEACNRKQWLVKRTEADRWFCLSLQSRGSWRPKWQLLAGPHRRRRTVNDRTAKQNAPVHLPP